MNSDGNEEVFDRVERFLHFAAEKGAQSVPEPVPHEPDENDASVTSA